MQSLGVAVSNLHKAPQLFCSALLCRERGVGCWHAPHTMPAAGPRPAGGFPYDVVATELLCSATAVCCATSFTHPLDCIKVRSLIDTEAFSLFVKNIIWYHAQHSHLHAVS